MSKKIKFIYILTFLFILICGISFATTENYSDQTQVTSVDSNVTSPDSNYSYSGITSVTQISDYSEANLGLNNILNIILIAIGILIILFAIAILIRLKQ